MVSSQSLRVRKQAERNKLLKEASELFGRGSGMSGQPGLVYSFSFSQSNPGDARIYTGQEETLVVIPNPIGKREVFVQVTKDTSYSEIVGVYVDITETEITISFGLGNFVGEFTAVIFG